MAAPIRLGAHVKLSDDPTPAGLTFQDVDVLGQRRPAPEGPPVSLDVTPFVVLDDERRIETEPFGLTIGLRDLADLKAEVRESILEQDLGEAAMADPQVAEMVPELDEIAAALNGQGVECDTGVLRALPFVVELEPEVEAHLR